MQRRSFLSAAAAAAILAPHYAVAAPAAVGQSAPDFTLTDTAGKPVRLADFKGKHGGAGMEQPRLPLRAQALRQGNMQALQKEAAAQGRGLAGDQLHRDRQRRLPEPGAAGALDARTSRPPPPPR